MYVSLLVVENAMKLRLQSKLTDLESCQPFSSLIENKFIAAAAAGVRMRSIFERFVLGLCSATLIDDFAFGHDITLFSCSRLSIFK